MVDAEQLEERIRASRQEAESTRQAAQATQTGQTVNCASCKQDVPVDGTFFSEMGEVCERCYRGVGQLL